MSKISFTDRWKYGLLCSERSILRKMREEKDIEAAWEKEWEDMGPEKQEAFQQSSPTWALDKSCTCDFTYFCWL